MCTSVSYQSGLHTFGTRLGNESSSICVGTLLWKNGHADVLPMDTASWEGMKEGHPGDAPWFKTNVGAEEMQDTAAPAGFAVQTLDVQRMRLWQAVCSQDTKGIPRHHAPHELPEQVQMLIRERAEFFPFDTNGDGA